LTISQYIQFITFNDYVFYNIISMKHRKFIY
jgi:hypothetical protein